MSPLGRLRPIVGRRKRPEAIGEFAPRVMFLFSAALVVAAGARDLVAQTVPEPPKISISAARLDTNGDDVPDRLGQMVTVVGRASVASGALHGRRLAVFIQDEEGGIKLYAEAVATPIHEGDTVVASGEVGHYRGATELRVARYHVVEHKHEPLVPHDLSLDEVSLERFEGLLVRVRGVVMDKRRNASGEYLLLRRSADGPRGAVGSIEVFLSSQHTQAISFERISAGDTVIVTGVLDEFAPGARGPAGFEIYPRSQSDIRLVGLSRVVARRLMEWGFAGLLVSLAWIVALRVQVTRRTREARVADEKFRAIYEGTTDAVLLLDPEWNVLDCNPAAYRVFGGRKGDLAAKSFASLLVAEDRPRATSLREDVMRDGAAEFDATGVVLGGGFVDLSIRSSAIIVEGLERVVVSLRDVSSHKRCLDELRRANEQLEAKVRERNEEVDGLNAALRSLRREVDRARDGGRES